jgi:hypothetical protein
VLVLVSFVLVLAAAVTLVVGLLQSGLTLIYLSIGCSVLAGVVLAVAVLRGRPEPKAAPIGRAYTPPASAPPAPATTSTYEPATTSTYQPPPAATTTYTPPPPPPPPRPAPVAPAAAGDDAAIKAAGTALLGRLRRSRGDEAEPEPAFASDAGPVTTEMPVVSAESDDGFPIDDYDSLRATDLLRRLGPLDRNQLEAVRHREMTGKNRFTILSRVDTLLAAKEEPAWEVEEDDWEPEPEGGPIAVGGVEDEDEFDVAGEMEDDEADEVEEDEAAFAVGPVSGADDGWDDEDEAFDELVSPVDEFPIAGYDSLTVGQILPRLSELDADELAQVRAREAAGRARGTILDRVDRLAAKSAPRAMPSAAPPARKAAAPRKARAAKAIAVPPPPPPVTPVRKRAAKKAAPEPVAAPAPRKARATKAAAAVPVPPATTTSPAKAAAKKATTARKAGGARKVTPPTEAEATTPMKAAVKKARAAKKRP